MGLDELLKYDIVDPCLFARSSPSVIHELLEPVPLDH
jgi:hypothetical protein